MGALFVFLSVLLIGAIFAIAIWLWLFIDIFTQVAELIQIKVEEQVAVWRIKSISRIAKLEQQQLHDRHKSRP